MRARPVLAGALAALTLVAVGCSGAEEEPPVERTAAERLAAARTVLADAGSVSLELTSTDVPEVENGVTAATGAGAVSATEPSFRGTITGTVQGIAATVEVVAIGEDTWLKLFTPDFEPFDLATLNAPNPATFLDPGAGIAGLLPLTGEPTLGPDFRAGKDVVTQVTGTLPGDRVAALFHLGDGEAEFRVTYGLTEGDELRTASLVGPFFGTTESTYTLTLTDYGVPVEITRP